MNLRKFCRTLFNRAKATRASQDWEKYKEKLRAYKSTLRKAQIDSWANFCGSVEDTSEVARLRKILASTQCTLRMQMGIGLHPARNR